MLCKYEILEYWGLGSRLMEIFIFIANIIKQQILINYHIKKLNIFSLDYKLKWVKE
jgi:hypothetical protein